MKIRMIILGLLVGLGLSATASPLAFAEEKKFLHQIPRVKGIVFEGGPSRRFLVGSGYGALSVMPNGEVERLSEHAGALSELMAHPKSMGVLFASGYRAKSEKLGVVRSDDGGRTWARISNGADGPVAFHAMAFNAADPSTMYGAEANLQVSRDDGKSWTVAGAPPAQVFDIAASVRDSKTLYVATREGLYRSPDEGASWVRLNPEKRPATIVHVTPDGRIYTFLYRLGLFVGEEPGSTWKLVSDKFHDRAIIDFAIDPADPRRMLAAVATGAVLLSRDGGANWISFEGQLDMTPQRISAGEKLYNENCQACHGVNGIGEKPGDPNARDEDGLPLAPAMDDSAHAWHHPDEQLITSILDGSPRNPRMAAWKDAGLTRDDARSLTAYIKSLWNFRSLACQGSRHMRCMH